MTNSYVETPVEFERVRPFAKGTILGRPLDERLDAVIFLRGGFWQSMTRVQRSKIDAVLGRYERLLRVVLNRPLPPPTELDRIAEEIVRELLEEDERKKNGQP